MNVLGHGMTRVWIALGLCTATAHADPPHPRPGPAVQWMTAPDFTLESTTGTTRRLRSLAGRVVVILYEDRAANHQNDVLKRELAERARVSDLARRVSLLPVANLQGYDFWPAAGFARSAVEDIARAQGVEILMDWTGAMATAYRFHPGLSHVVVIDPEGRVVFRHDGAMDPGLRQRFFTVLAGVLQGPEGNR